MNPSTASNRLVKDLLFSFVQKEGHKCFHCGGEISREDFSIEHKIPWLDSDDPIGLFFDLDNIAFSHFKCNSGKSRYNQPNRYKHPSINSYNKHGCRCEECKEIKKQHNARRNKK